MKKWFRRLKRRRFSHHAKAYRRMLQEDPGGLRVYRRMRKTEGF